MATLRLAPTRYPSQREPQWKEVQILTKTASRQEGGLGAKNNYNYCMQKQHQCKITKALLNPEAAPHTINEGNRWPALSRV